MTYKDDFNNADGWSAADVSIRLNTSKGRQFLAFLRQSGVGTIIRYYATRLDNPKTLTAEEAQLISAEGFAILPVFQDSSRKIENFSTESGTRNAKSAKAFAQTVGQPAGVGSAIVFAVDWDYSPAEIDGPIRDYFQAIRQEIGDDFAIGAYGSGALLSKLQAEHLIDLAWISMSRGFTGTEAYFYANQWAMRQLPPEVKHEPSGIGYDRDVLRISQDDLGAFRVDANGTGARVGGHDDAATLGGGVPPSAPVTETANDRLVTTEGLNFRDAPNGKIIQALTIADRVIDHGLSDNPAWRAIEVGGVHGFSADKYLRAPVRPEIESLLRATVDEWLRFEKGKGREEIQPWRGYVREMWAAIGEPYDGASKYANGEDVPWSAAFISWAVRKAGPAYANFQFAASHSVFVNNAIKARVTGRLDKPFWGYRITEQKPELGDIIQRNRGGGAFSFSYAENHAEYSSHSDIVVEVTPDVVRVIGGNVGDTVSYGTALQEYHLTDAGLLAPGQNVIALLKNRAGLAGPI